MNLLKSSLLALALVASAPMAMAAGSAQAPIAVSLTLQNTCAITTSPVAFGTVTTLAAALPASGSVTVTCTSNGGSYTVAFNGGTTAGGTISQRKLTNGTDTINYNLYTTTGYTAVLGDGTTGQTVGGTGNGAAQVYNVYGQTAANQNSKSVGTYTDTVTATVTF